MLKEQDRVFDFERHGEQYELSLRYILHHLIDHEAQHKGQILMLKANAGSEERGTVLLKLSGGFRWMNLRIERWNEAGKPLANLLRQRLAREGYGVFEWSDAPGTVYRPHSHTEDQSHWIISGALELTVAGESYTLRAGDRDFLPANTAHSAFVPGDEPVRYLIGSKA